MSAASDLATVLQTAGIGTLGDDLFWGRGLTDTPDAQTSVQQYGGLPPEMAMTDVIGKVIAERPRCQIVCRANEYAVAEAQARLAWSALTNYKATPGAGSVMYVSPVQSPFSMGPDQQNRWLYGFNVDCWIEGN
jgi:hypothetical protein